MYIFFLFYLPLFRYLHNLLNFYCLRNLVILKIRIIHINILEDLFLKYLHFCMLIYKAMPDLLHSLIQQVVFACSRTSRNLDGTLKNWYPLAVIRASTRAEALHKSTFVLGGGENITVLWTVRKTHVWGVWGASSPAGMLGRGCLGQSCRTHGTIGFVPHDAGVAVATPGPISGYQSPSGEWVHVNLGKKFAHMPFFWLMWKEERRPLCCPAGASLVQLILEQWWHRCWNSSVPGG